MKIGQNTSWVPSRLTFFSPEKKTTQKNPTKKKVHLYRYLWIGVFPWDDSMWTIPRKRSQLTNPWTSQIVGGLVGTWNSGTRFPTRNVLRVWFHPYLWVSTWSKTTRSPIDPKNWKSTNFHVLAHNQDLGWQWVTRTFLSSMCLVHFELPRRRKN